MRRRHQRGRTISYYIEFSLSQLIWSLSEREANPSIFDTGESVWVSWVMTWCGDVVQRALLKVKDGINSGKSAVVVWKNLP